MIEINETKEILEKLTLEGKTRVLAKSAGSSIGAKDCWVYQNNV